MAPAAPEPRTGSEKKTSTAFCGSGAPSAVASTSSSVPASPIMWAAEISGGVQSVRVPVRFVSGSSPPSSPTKRSLASCTRTRSPPRAAGYRRTPKRPAGGSGYICMLSSPASPSSSKLTSDKTIGSPVTVSIGSLKISSKLDSLHCIGEAVSSTCGGCAISALSCCSCESGSAPVRNATSRSPAAHVSAAEQSVEVSSRRAMSSTEPSESPSSSGSVLVRFEARVKLDRKEGSGKFGGDGEDGGERGGDGREGGVGGEGGGLGGRGADGGSGGDRGGRGGAGGGGCGGGVGLGDWKSEPPPR
eukprot:2611173-Pleurochrysis_carterae.AAC.2